MEPIAAQQGISPSLRPTLSLHGDLAAVLQHGRVVAGEVMQKLDGGSLLLGVGRHRVAAQAGVELPVGKRFLARVERPEGGGAVLRLLGVAGESSGGKLASALGGAARVDRPVGELLRSLASTMRGDGNASLGRLAGQVEGHVFQPGSSGAELQALVARAGMHYEAALLAYALKGAPGTTAAEELQALAKKLAAEAALAVSQVQGPHEAAAVAAVGERLQRQLLALLRKERGRGATRAEIATKLEGVLAKALGGASTPELRAAIARAVGDSELLAALAKEGGALSDDLKAQLLGALAEAPEGETRDAIERALAGLEREQLWNAARRESQDGWCVAIPVPDGDAWTTAQLVVAEDSVRADDEDGTRRWTVAVDFSRLGPIRAELSLRPGELTLAIHIASEETAAKVGAALDGLHEVLARDGRRVLTQVRVDAAERLDPESLVRDVRWTRENHLLDCEG